jgi:MYXO-CTERM domain-containing protein
MQAENATLEAARVLLFGAAMSRRARFMIAVAAAAASVACGSGPDERTGAAAEPIIGGDADSTHSGVVATGSQNQFCSGFLIMPDLVLTAHHCTADPATLPSTACADGALMPPSLPASEMMVVPGADIMSAPYSYPVATIANVPDMSQKPLCGNDVAVLQLKDPLSGVTPIDLDPSAIPSVGEPVTLVGYGRTDPSNPDSIGIRESVAAKVDHVGAEQSATGTFAVDGEFSVDLGPCPGDSGSPALADSGAAIGVMSRGNTATCAHMVYSSVAAHADWLGSLVRDSATRLGIAPPAWAAGPDAGTEPDGAAGSAGSAASSDAGNQPATGQSASDSSGCSVDAGTPRSELSGAALVMLVLAARRRRRASENR